MGEREERNGVIIFKIKKIFFSRKRILKEHYA